MASILIVEDDRIVAWSIQEALEHLGHRIVASVISGIEALQYAAHAHPDLILIDICLQGEVDGIALAEEICSRFGIPFIYLTAHTDDLTLKKAITTEPFGYLIKPLRKTDLQTTIEIALRRHHLEKKLADTEQRLATTLASIGDGTIAADCDGQITLMNPTAEALTGWSQQDALGKPVEWVIHLIHADTRKPLDNPLLQAMREGRRVQLPDRCLLCTRDGKERLVSDSAAPIKNSQGEVTGSVLVFQDVSDRLQTEETLHKYTTIFEHAELALAIDSSDGKTRQIVNQAFATMHGYTIEELVGKPIIELLPSTYHAQFEDFMHMVDAMGHRTFECRHLRKDGTIFPVLIDITSIKDNEGQLRYRIVSLQDITYLKQAEEVLWQQAERERLMVAISQRIRESLNLNEILDTTVSEVRQYLQADRVLLYQLSSLQIGTLVAASVHPDWSLDAARDLHQTWKPHLLTPVEQVGTYAISDINPPQVSPESLKFAQQLQIKAKLSVPLQRANQLWGVLTIHQCSESRQWQLTEVEFLEQLATQVSIAIQQSELYQQLQAANQELQRFADLDGLTQIANRRCFDHYLDQEWRRLSRENAALTLILCDIDYFKPYNDTYGHLAGDACLIQIAQTINRTVKRTADLAARYGGEEFAIILPYTDSAGAVQIIQTIGENIKQLHLVHASSPIGDQITLSYGVATAIPSPTSRPTVLIDKADRALYQAKAEGRDRYCVDPIPLTD